MLSRLKGIETYFLYIHFLNHYCAYMPSRLKGIETGGVTRPVRGDVYARAYMPSRLKGIETGHRHARCREHEWCIYAFPFEGN